MTSPLLYFNGGSTIEDVSAVFVERNSKKDSQYLKYNYIKDVNLLFKKLHLIELNGNICCTKQNTV